MINSRTFILLAITCLLSLVSHSLYAQCAGVQDDFCYSQFSSDEVGISFTPDAGKIAQSTILSGSVGSTSPNTLTVYEGADDNMATGSIVFGPASSADFSGTIISATTPNLTLKFVFNAMPGFFGCSSGSGFDTPLVVCSESLDEVMINFPDLPALCINTGVIMVEGGATPPNGVYSGDGVTNVGDGLSFNFDTGDPNVSLGPNTITYTIAPNSADANLELVAAPTVTFPGLASVSIDAGVQTGLGGATPTGGVYSGPGVTNNGNGTSFSFNPAVAGLGTHIINYTEGGPCAVSATATIEVTPANSCSPQTTFFHCSDFPESDLVIFEICPTSGQFARATINQGTYSNFGNSLRVYQGSTSGPILFTSTPGDLGGTIIDATATDECLIFVSTTATDNTCQNGLEEPLVVCGSSFISQVQFTAFGTISINAGVQSGLSGGTPIGGVYDGPGVDDDVNGETYTFDPMDAGLGPHTLTYTLDGNVASDQIVVVNLEPAGFSKNFSPSEMGPGSVSTLNFIITNPNAAGITDIAFEDVLPAGMTIATPAIITNSCGTGTISAPAGGLTISYTGGTLTGSGSCTISVNVSSSTVGTHTNTTGDLTSNAGNSGTASANLTVASNRPGFSKSFFPSTVNIGEASTLTFTIDNSANTNSVFNPNFTDNLPEGMVVADVPNLSISAGCPTGGTVMAIPGGTSITYENNFNINPIANGAICTISIDVIATNAASLDNVTSDLTVRTSLFSQQILSSGKASATLEVQTPPEIFVDKSFSPNPVQPGGTTNLNFTITNFSRDFSATNISFTDDLSTVLSGLMATGTPISGVCGAGSQISGTSVLSLTGGVLAPESSCTFSVAVQVPAGAALGTYPNTTGTVSADIGGSPVTGNMTTEDLVIANVPIFTKTFLNDPIVAGETSTLEFTITNTSPTSAASNISFTDNISAFISGATVTALPPAGSCGAGSVFTTTGSGELVFQLNNGEIAAGGSCTFSIDILIPENTGGLYTNTTTFLSATVDGAGVLGQPATDDLTVLDFPRLSKSFTDDPVDAGDIVNLEFTISYDEFATSDATGISFTDDLNAVIPGLAAIGLPINDVCGTGSQLSGTTNLSFTGGSLSPGEECTFSVPVQVPAGALPGTYTNTTSDIVATVQGQTSSGSPATDDLMIGGLTFTKEFLDDPVIPGGTAILEFTFDNTTMEDASITFFTDNLSAVLPGLAAVGLPSQPCGPVSNISGTTFLIFTAGEVPANSSCTFQVVVEVPVGTPSDTYNNTTSSVLAVINSQSIILPPATDQLVVNDNLLALTKSFVDDPVAPGDIVTVEYTLTNLDPDNAATGITFTNNFEAALPDLVALGLPANDVCGIGSEISGTGLVTLTGGNLPAGGSCTFSITLQTPTDIPSTIINCTTSEVSGTIGGFAVVGDAAADDLLFESVQLEKVIAGPVVPGDITTITFTLTNLSESSPANQIEFSDDLEAFISGMTITELPIDLSACGQDAVISGAPGLLFSRGSLAPGESCTFEVSVLVPCNTEAATYTNTTSTVTGQDGFGLFEAPAASADLTVNIEEVTFTAPDDLCLNGEQIELTGGTPLGGFYDGPGVIFDNNTQTYFFDPTEAGVGIKTLMYTYTNSNGCPFTASDDIEVLEVRQAAFTAPDDLCIDAQSVELTGGTPAGGVYEGPGVIFDNNAQAYFFDPNAAGADVHTLSYTFTEANACSSTASDQIEVFDLPTVTFTAPVLDVCIEDAIVTGLGGGSPTGGTYSGNGVSNNMDGTFNFDPTAAAPDGGNITITYTYVDGNQCSNTATSTIFVDEICCELEVTCPSDDEIDLECISELPAGPSSTEDFADLGGSINSSCNPNDLIVTFSDNDDFGTGCINSPRVVERTITVSDPLTQESVDCSIVYVFKSLTGPQITVVPALTVDCKESINPNPAWAEVITDCNLPFNIEVDLILIEGLENCSGTTYTYRYTLTDACDRTAFDDQVYTIQNEGPTMACPDNCEVFGCYDGQAQAVIDAWINTVTATSSCSDALTVTNDYEGILGTCVNNGYTPVLFTATDNCNPQRTVTCESLIIIVDDDAPTITEQASDLLRPCTANTAGELEAWLNDHGGAEAYDNCDQDLEWSYEPEDALSMLNCSNGPQAIVVTFTVADICGNDSQTTAIFNTKLLPNVVNVAGLIQTEATEAVAAVEVAAYQSSGITEMSLSDESGDYYFEALPFEENTEIVPSRDGDWLNGVSTYDLILLQQHILGINELNSPYKRIAADANRSGSISTLDLVLLRRLILLVDEALADNTSWRFVDANFVFPDPINPFETTFPEVFTLSGEEEEYRSFVAVKIGDLNLDAEANSFSGNAGDRSNLDELVFTIEDQALKAGQEYMINVNALNFEAVRGFQMTLEYDHSLISVLDIDGSALPGFDAANFNLAYAEQGKVPLSWNIQHAESLDAQDVPDTYRGLRILINANANVNLSEALAIGSGMTRAEAYGADLMNVTLNYTNNSSSVIGNKFQLFQNQPNPFKAATVIGFMLPVDGEVLLEIFDVSGRLIYSERSNYAAGYQAIDLNRRSLPSGVLYYQVSTADDSASKKMIVLK